MRVKLFRSIGAKIFLLISFCLVLAIAFNSWQSSQTFQRFLTKTIEEDVVKRAQTSSKSINSVFSNWKSQISVATHALMSLPKGQLKRAAKGFVHSDREFIAFNIISEKKGRFRNVVYSYTDNYKDKRFHGKKLAPLRRSNQKETSSWVKTLSQSSSDRIVHIRSHSPNSGMYVSQMAIPFVLKKQKMIYWAVLTSWQTRLLESLPNSATLSSALITNDKRIYTSSLKEYQSNPQSLSNLALIEKALTTYSPSGMQKWIGADDVSMLGAFSKIPSYDVAVVFISNGNMAEQAVMLTAARSALVALFLLIFALGVSYMGASGITKKLREVVSATKRISAGDFDHKIESHSSDEVGVLSNAVNNMSGHIQELMKTEVEMAKVEKELETAKMVQETFFPKDDIETDEIKIAARFRPASQCGGDWWGHYPLPGDREFVFIADATGHGVPAALVTAMIFSLSSLLANFIEKNQDNLIPLPEVLRDFNDVLWAAGKGNLTMTFFAALIDYKSGEVTYSNAGHNFPLLLPQNADDNRFVGADKTTKYKLKKNQVSLRLAGDPLGMMETVSVDQVTIPLRQGDKLFLYTDGIFECAGPDGSQWGKPQFTRAVKDLASESPEKFRDEIFERAFNHFEDVPPDDDITVVVVEMKKIAAELAA